MTEPIHSRRACTAVVTLLLAFAAACGGGGDQRAGAAGGGGAAGAKTFSGRPAGGTAIVIPPEGREPDNLNPLTYDSSPAFQVVRLVFRALARRDSTLSNYTPDLLESWGPGTTPNSLVLRMRRDVKWHDGVPVTAEDVVFTIQQQKSDAIASPRKNDVASVQSVSARDSFTVDVQLDRAGPATINALLEVVPVPKHLLKDVAPAQMRFAPFSRRPVGNGFFRFDRWDAGQQLILTANREMPEGRPALDRLVLRFVPDVNAAMTDLLSGNADAMKIPPEQKGRVASAKNVKLYTAPRVRPAWIAWNVRKPPMDDPRLRRAFLLATNRPAAVAKVFGAEGEAALSPIPTKLREHSSAVRPIPYDLARANALLDSAGWMDTNGDGVREKNGRPLKLTVDYNSSDQNRKDVLIAIQAQVKQAGIDLQLQPYESTTWVQRLRAGQFQGSFWGWGWGPGVVGPNAVMIWSSRSIPPGGPNFAGYRNPRLDAMLDSAVVETDSARYKALWARIEQTVIDDAVYQPIYLDLEYYAVNARIQGVKFRGIEFWEDVPYWYIPVEKRIGRDRG